MTEEAARNGPKNNCQRKILFNELETRHTRSKIRPSHRGATIAASFSRFFCGRSTKHSDQSAFLARQSARLDSQYPGYQGVVVDPYLAFFFGQNYPLRKGFVGEGSFSQRFGISSYRRFQFFRLEEPPTDDHAIALWSRPPLIRNDDAGFASLILNRSTLPTVTFLRTSATGTGARQRVDSFF